jgi:chitodextrinase
VVAAQLIKDMLQGVRDANVQGMKVGAGFGTWSMSDPTWLSGFVKIPLDFLDLHVYPVNKNFLQNMVVATDAARANGLDVAFSEVWAYKEADSELGTLTPTAGFARDVFDFWSPLDVKFLQAMVDFTQAKKIAFLSPFWTHFFYGYLPSAVYQDAPDADLLNAINQLSVTAYMAGIPTETGKSWSKATLNFTDITPPVVPGAMISNAGVTALNFSWPETPDNVGTAAYEVFRNGVRMGRTALPVWYDTNLASGAKYSYQVSAWDAMGNVSALSTPLPIQTLDNLPPSVPQNLNAANITAVGAVISWAPSTDNSGVVKGYYVWRGTTASNMTAVGNVTVPTFTDRLIPDTQYYYAVQAYDTTGWQSPKSVILPMRSLKDLTAPSVPTGLQARPLSATTVSLTWMPSIDNYYVGAYLIYRGKTSTSMTLVASTPTPAYTDNKATANQTYFYQISAKDLSNNESAQTSAVSLKTPIQ